MNKKPSDARLAIVLACLIALSVLALVSADDGGRISSNLGRQLLLVSPPEGRLQALGALPVTVHAQIGGEGRRYLASGQASSAPSLRSAGVSPVVLDPDTRGKVYYFLDAQAKGARRLAQQWGSIFFEDDTQILVGIPLAKESAFLDTVAQTSIHIELLTNIPLRQPAEGDTVRGATATEANPLVVSLLPLITPERLAERVAELSGERPALINGKKTTLQTRYTFSGQIGDALAYVRQALTNLGLQVQDVEWAYGRWRGINLVADLPGTKHPERIWLIGGHLDSRSESPYRRAPGADDNASGVAAMLVIAEIIKGQQFEDTIRFVAFTGEEQGMWGSKSYAARLSSGGAQVVGFLNLDMLGWDGNDDRVVEVHGSTRLPSEALARAFASVNERYKTGLTIEVKTDSASRFSDHSPFWDAGYPAVMAIENFFRDISPADANPKYHNTGDVLARLRLDYMTRYAQAALAAIAEWAGIGSEEPALPTPTVSPAPPSNPPATPVPSATPQATPTPSPTPGEATAVPTAGATSSSRGTGQSMPTVVAAQGNCRDVLANGGMETQAGWTLGLTLRRASYVPSPATAGARSLRLGIEPPTSDRLTHSSAWQRVSIPAGVRSAVLTAQVWRGSQDSAGDYQEMLLLTNRYRLLRTLQRGLATDNGWQAVRYDVHEVAGQDVVIYLNVYNDGDGRRSWMYVDDVRLTVCAL